MNRIILCILFSFSITAALSQKVYFIYVQTESDQPFYLKLNDRVYTSTGPGYLILSNLRDTTYNLRIGFPQNKNAENSFTINVNHKDHGFLLKDFGEKGWGLFDIQTLSVQYPVVAESKSGTTFKDDGKGGSAFTQWLALAIDDPSIKEKPVFAVEEKRTEVMAKDVAQKEDLENAKSAVDVAKTDVPVNKTAQEKIDSDAVKEGNKKAGEAVVKPDVFKQKTGGVVTKTEPVKDDAAKPSQVLSYKPSQVTKKSESSSSDGFGLVYVDEYANGIDTIRILIPNVKNEIAAVKQQPKEELKFLDFGDTVKKQEPVIDKETKPSNTFITIEKGKNDKESGEKQVNDSKETKPSNTYITIEKGKNDKETSDNQVNNSKEANPNTYITIEPNIDKKKCPAVAGDNDFFVLRKKMASEKAEVDMLWQANKYFKTKCFTTYQLKNLSALFLTDAAKFRFFDAAYAFVADEVNFKTLESELKDDYYITRFQGMIQHKNP